jgi:hypothetical protein
MSHCTAALLVGLSIEACGEFDYDFSYDTCQVIKRMTGTSQ